MSLLALEKRRFYAFVQFLAAGGPVLQPELIRSAVIKIIFSSAQAMNAARRACWFYSIFQSHCQLITPHNIIDLPWQQKEGCYFSRDRGNLWPIASCITQNLMNHQICVSIQLPLQYAALLNLFRYIYLISFLIINPPILRSFLINIALICVSKGILEHLQRLLPNGPWFLHSKRLLRLQSQVFRH